MANNFKKNAPATPEGEAAAAYDPAPSINLSDPIALLEAAALAAGGDNYRRNSALQNIIRAYLAEMNSIKELQGRIFERNKMRDDANETAKILEKAG